MENVLITSELMFLISIARFINFFIAFLFKSEEAYSFFFFFSSRRRHTRSTRDWSSDVCSSDLHSFSHRRWGSTFGDHALRAEDRKSTRLNSSHEWISYAVFCLKKKT